MHPAKAEGAGIIMRRLNPFRLGSRKTEETPALPAPQEEEVDLVEIPRFPEDGEAETDKISVSKEEPAEQPPESAPEPVTQADETAEAGSRPKTRPEPRPLLTGEQKARLMRPVTAWRKRRAAKKQARLQELERIERDSSSPIDAERGLTDAQAEARVRLGKVNRVEKKGVRSTGQIIFSHTVTYFNFLNIFLGVLVFLTGQYKNMLFLGVIICNSLIGIVQELRVRDLILKLSVISASKAKVRRNGSVEELPIEEIVTDDIVEITSGDQIVTDGSLMAGDGIEINESMLTGESKPVRKQTGDSLLSGSFVVSGSGTMKVEKVGRECYAQQIVEKSHHRRRASSEMQITIGRIIKVVSIAIIPVGLLLFRSQHAAAVRAAAGGLHDAHWIFARSIVRTVAGVIGMIPEGLVLLTSVSFIIGVGRLAMKRALVQEMEAIESLARVNILCTDKTGTITTGKLRMARLISVGGIPADEIRAVAAHMNGAFSDKNDTQEALDAYFGRKTDWPVTASVPFSSERKYKSVTFEGRGTYLMGAPEYLVPDRKDVLRYIDRFQSEGYRVLALARRSGEGPAVPQALCVISDVVKPDAKEVFDYFAKAGVEVKVLSGDNPVTVSAVAVKAGVRGASRYLDASTLPDDQDKLAEAIRGYQIFGRVRPEQKQAFVKAWQKEGNTVAMVGDGVNDVLALKDADCGIAMAHGSEAAKQAAHIVLLDSDFSTMKDIVAEGKTIICNIERVSALYLTKTIYACLLSMIFAILTRAYPWTTLQMGLINVCGIGMPSFLLTLEQHEGWKAEGFLPHVLKTCVPAALTMVFSILMVLCLGTALNWSDELISLFYLMAGGFVALLVVGQVSWPFNWYRRGVFGISVGAFVLGLIIFPGFYDISALWSSPWVMLIFPMAFVIVLVITQLSRLTKKLMQKRFRPRKEHLAG